MSVNLFLGRTYNEKKLAYSAKYNSIVELIPCDNKFTIFLNLHRYTEGVFGNYLAISGNNNKLVMFPMKGRTVELLELNTKEITEYTLIDEMSIAYLFFGALTVGNYIVGVPGRYSAFLCYDLLKNEFKEIAMDTDILKYKYQYFGKSFCELNGKVYAASKNQSYIIAVDVESNKIEYEKVLTEKEGFYSLCSDGEKLYALGNDGKLYVLCETESGINCVSVMNLGLTYLKEDGYAMSQFFCNKIVVFVPEDEDLLVINIDKKRIEKVDVKISNQEETDISSLRYLYSFCDNDELTFMSAIDGVERVLDKNLSVIAQHSYTIDNSEEIDINIPDLVYEKKGSYIGNIEVFLDKICQR